jgi:ribosomal subunit interface protein
MKINSQKRAATQTCGKVGVRAAHNLRSTKMEIPLQVVARGATASDAVDTEIRKRAAKLERFCDHITSCRVTVETETRRQQQGRLYSVHVDLNVPGDEIVSSRGHENEDIHMAICDAFDAVQRRLEDYVRERRGQVKQHVS